MEYMNSSESGGSMEQTKTYGKILCCECGLAIDPNPANMCISCLRSQVDITADIAKQCTVTFCKFCERYLQGPSTWMVAALESKELLAICLKKIRGLNKVRLIDAGFVWTEPHSKRLRVKLVIQKEVLNGAILQQTFQVEFVVQNQICESCQRIEAKDYWRAAVQVRQKIAVSHKKTLLYMEQLILKHGLHLETSSIKPINGGIDFYYAKQQDARRMVDFLMGLLPCRYQTAEELVTHDPKNNVFDYKHTFSVELVPVCKDNVVCLPKKLAQSLGNLGQVCVCIRISNFIHLIDPQTGQIADVSSTTYWRSPFSAISGRDLTEYTVLDVELVQLRLGKGHGQVSTKHAVAEAWIVRSCDLGTTDGQEISVKTHLGHLLKPGDTALGFDLANSNVNDTELNKLRKENLPDVILVKKVYAERSRRRTRRNWRLKHLEDRNGAGQDSESMLNDYEEFLEDLEEDPASRQHVNIYRKSDMPPVVPLDPNVTGDVDELPQISLQEMLDDLTLSDEEMPDAADDAGV